MDQPQITFNGRTYQVELRHPGLNKFQIVTGKTGYEVQEKAAAKLAEWNEMWTRKQSVEQAQAQRSQVAKERQDNKDLAARRTADVQALVESLGQLLIHTLSRDDRISWDTLKDHAVFSKPKPTIPQPPAPAPLAIPSPPVRSHPKYQPKLGLLDHLSSARRTQKTDLASRLYDRDYQAWLGQKANLERQATAGQQEHQRQVAEWRSQVQRAEAQWASEKADFERHQAQTNAEIDKLRERYNASEPGAVAAYCRLVLLRSQYPPTLVLPRPTFKVDYNAETRILVVEYPLPSPSDMPTVKEVKYVQSRDAIEQVALPGPAVNALYDAVLYQIALRTIHELYEADVVSALESVVFNGWVTAVDKSTGQEVSACILSLQAGRTEFLAINLGQVDPKECFRKLKGVGSSKLHGLAPVAPILQLSRDDKRFIQGREVADKLSEGDNLASMDWEEFEHLVRELFEKEFVQSGGEVKVTQASRDRGVDAIAFDPDPIRGGKIVIQAKRYTNTVDVSAVRDLYGTVVNEGATKGILVTTSNYGPEAYEFAKGKPLTLLNGGNLLSLLEKHGHKARIDLEEARRLLTQE